VDRLGILCRPKNTQKIFNKIVFAKIYRKKKNKQTKK